MCRAELFFNLFRRDDMPRKLLATSACRHLELAGIPPRSAKGHARRYIVARDECDLRSGCVCSGRFGKQPRRVSEVSASNQ